MHFNVYDVFYFQFSHKRFTTAETIHIITRTEYYKFQKEQDLRTFYETGVHIHRPCST
jgi:hypothetical protein